MNLFVSDLSKKKFPVDEKIQGEAVRNSIMKLIQQDFPDFDSSKSLALPELNVYREKYMSEYLKREMGKLSDLDNKVLEAIGDKSLITEESKEKKNAPPTVGQKVADKVAAFGGSWTFIIIFVCFMLGWIALNALWLGNKGLDPYPFILLNLMLSCLAALQAPIIMMSQNRQSQKDRQQAEDDYMINLKSELELQSLHEKIDHLMLYQQQELIEIQKIQIDMLTDIQKQITKDRKTAKNAL